MYMNKFHSYLIDFNRKIFSILQHKYHLLFLGDEIMEDEKEIVSNTRLS